MATAALTGIGGSPTHEHPLKWIITGSEDPSAGSGVVAGAGSLYLRNDAGTGSLWVKVDDASDTAWQLVTLAV